MRAAPESARRSLALIDGGDGGRGLAERSQLAVAAVGAAEAGEAPLTFAAAIETFRRCRLPWDEAEALHLWGRSLLAGGEAAQACEKLEEALELYRRHSAAAGWTDRVREGVATARRPAAPGDRVSSDAPNTMSRQGEYWTIVFEGQETRLRNSKGLEHLSVLLARPGQELHVLELAAAAGTSQRRSSRASAPELQRESGDAGELLDPQAKAAYRQRITELEA